MEPQAWSQTEKNFLIACKVVRDIWKLESKPRLAKNQLDKIAKKPEALNHVLVMLDFLAADSDLRQRNGDVIEAARAHGGAPRQPSAAVEAGEIAGEVDADDKFGSLESQAELLVPSRRAGRDLAYEIKVDTVWASKLDPEARPTGVTRPDDREVWLVEDLLTIQECQDLISAAEEYGYGATTYPKAYRGNLRLIATDTSLAAAMWTRLQPFVPPTLELDGDTWQTVGLNEVWRLSKYHPGDCFQPHCDASFARGDDETSMLTVNIYMNANFEGGSTRFYANSRALEANLTVEPKPGLCLLFRQPPEEMYCHDGERVVSGQKYLFRSDVMYRRRCYVEVD